MQIEAYTQEAKLIGTLDFPPLSRTVDDIRTSQDQFLVAYAGEQLVGSISVEPALEYLGNNISGSDEFQVGCPA